MQQINLFTDAFKPPKVKLPLEQIIAFPILALIIFIGISFALSSYLASQKSELIDLQKKHEEMTKRLSVLTEKAEKLRQDEGLIAANQRLNKTLIARRNMISTLDRVVLKEAEGFSHLLISLARQKEDGLWLTSIQLGGSDRQMILEGQTKKAELVPSYLQKLRNEPSFLGRNFSLFELKESEGNNEWLGFTLKAEDSKTEDLNETQALSIQPLIKKMDTSMIDSLAGEKHEP